MRKINGIIIMATEEAVKFVGRVLKDTVLIDRAVHANKERAEIIMQAITEYYSSGCYEKAIFWTDELYRLAGYNFVRRVKVE